MIKWIDQWNQEEEIIIMKNDQTNQSIKPRRKKKIIINNNQTNWSIKANKNI